MKTKLSLSLLFFGIILFSGCSLVPQSSNNTQTGVKSFELSKNIWKSTDGGKTWEAKTKGEGAANIKDINILTLAINPTDGNDIFAGLKKGGILESKDGGEIWKFLPGFTSEKVYGLAIDPRDGKTLYASGIWQGRGKIFKSPDLGETWKEIYTSPSNGPFVISLALDKNNPDTIYVTTSDNEALKSLNGGASWKNIYSARAPILKIAIDGKNSNLIYFITNSGEIFRSSDGGGNFENIADKIRTSLKDSFGSNFNVLETDSSVAGRIYIGGQSGLLESSDNGDTWKKIPTLSNSKTFPVKALAVNPQNSNDLIYGAAQSSYQSSDGGINWSTSQFDIKSLVRTVLYDPANPSTVFLGFSQ